MAICSRSIIFPATGLALSCTLPARERWQFRGRQLYTDDEEVLFKAARPNPQKANQKRSKPNLKRKRSLDDGYRTIIIAQIPRQLSSTSNFFL
jgi:hypothetical protein